MTDVFSRNSLCQQNIFFALTYVFIKVFNQNTISARFCLIASHASLKLQLYRLPHTHAHKHRTRNVCAGYQSSCFSFLNQLILSHIYPLVKAHKAKCMVCSAVGSIVIFVDKKEDNNSTDIVSTK